MPKPDPNAMPFQVLKLVICATALLLCGSSAVAAQSTCRLADGTTRKTIPVIDSVVNGRTQRYQLLRDSLHVVSPKRPVTPSLVTSASTCVSAGKALDALDSIGTTARNLYLYQAGSYYVVDDPQRLLGEFRDLVFFTSKWVYQGDLAQ